MNFQFLGTGAATSMPLLFCNCRVCKQARLLGGKNMRKRASALIDDKLLIDLGPDAFSQAEMYNIDLGKVTLLLQTHSHSDHFDAGHFITRSAEYGAQNLAQLDVVCSNGTCMDMNHWVQQNEPSFDIWNCSWQRNLNYRLNLIKSGETLPLGEYQITALDSLHDSRVEALVYIITKDEKSILYGTDLLGLSPHAQDVLERFKLDLVVLDHTYGEGTNQGGHLDGGQVVQIIRQMIEKKIIHQHTPVYATHISHEGNDVHQQMQQQALQKGYSIAYDGLKVTV